MMLFQWCFFYFCCFFFFNDTATTEIYTLSLHDALPIWNCSKARPCPKTRNGARKTRSKSSPTDTSPKSRSEEHTSELQSQFHLVCRLLLEKKKKKMTEPSINHTKNNMTPLLTPTLDSVL